MSPTPGSVISALHTKPTASRLNTPRLYVTKSHRMESKDFGDTLNGAMTAHVPIVAAHTSEVDATIAEVLKFGLTTVPEMRVKGPEGGPVRVPMNKKAKTFVWRQADEGYREWNLYYPGGHPQQFQIVNRVEGPEDEDLEIAAPNHGTEIILCDGQETGDPFRETIEYIENWDWKADGPALFILRDIHYHLNPLQGTQKGLGADDMEENVDRLARACERIAGMAKYVQIIILHETRWHVPAELDGFVYRVRIHPPNKESRIEKIRYMKEGIEEDASSIQSYPKVANMTDVDIEDVADAGAGLTSTQFENLLCMSLANNADMSGQFILREKAKLVEQAGFKLITPKESFDNIGGLEPLKKWARRRKRRFTDAAGLYGFRRAPRGMLLAGVPGCGKTLLAKATAKEWNMNIIAVRAPDLKGSLVGESEEKTQKLLDMAEANGPCVVFIDEAEKLLGSQDSVRDGGAHDAVLAQFLSFMQDNEAGVYFIFTANQMNKFPPELVDRFEGRWFVDLPSADEREGILNIHLSLNASDTNGLMEIANDESIMEKLIKKTEGFSGRNIEQAVEEAMDLGFEENRPVTIEDFNEVFNPTTGMKPTSETRKADIEAMREFVGNGTMRIANTPENTVDGKSTFEAFKPNRGFA